ncbi:alpha/beta hydrolase family protein [Silvibacterium dinghuense]|uniref:S9 family peptidase n=1 Tax=Silvibacterium dinghuense TaxID=1560006 RepID=A0A4Q1S9D2_9BACT|nr:S9 family peptidase [Silvibacterium dinghuense]RXS93483.1 S9 family peptidase [Silvibacterium dinghuense]GGH04185.1 peptidase S9 [Silvibacterium dinghuense]
MLPLGLMAAALLSASPFPALAQTQKPAEAAPAHDPRIPALLHDLAQVHSIRETALSPDGQWIAWNDGRIELAPLTDTRHPRMVTACQPGARGAESGLAWSPDSKSLAFFSECTPDHKTAIFLDDAASSTAPRQLTALNGYAKELEFTPDGKSLSFLYVEGATRPSGALAAMKPFSGVIGVEGLEVQRVAAVDAATGALTHLTPENLHVYEFSWSHDAKQLTYVAAPPPGENNWWVAKLFTQAPGSQPKVVFDPSTTTGALHGLQIAVPRFSPDGTQIAFIGGLMSDQGSTGGDIYSIPSTGGDATDLTPNREASPAWFQWIDDSRLGIAETKNAASHLFVWDLHTRQESSAYNLTLPASVGAGGLSMQISVASNNTIAFIESSFAHPPEVWAGEINDLHQITHLNDGLQPSWGKSEAVSWTNEGFHVDGWLLYPANYDPAKKYGLIVYVHGGPSAANMPRWPGAGFGAAPFSALGYFVLLPNPRGSFGEGEKFTQANRKDFGYGDLRDIVAGVDAITASHPIDPQRVGITGWSYGGFMTMFAVTQTGRFHAAVAGAGLSNWQSYYGENSIDQWMIPFFGASVYDDPAVYAKSSAINFIKNVKTPTLVVVGDRDGECPAPQSFEFWHALRDQHVPTQLVVYPDEGHGFVNPEHRVDVLERALTWFDQYLQ